MSTPILNLVRERIDEGVSQAGDDPLRAHIGLWLGVIADIPGWKPALGLKRYQGIAEAGAALAATGDAAARSCFVEGVAWLQQRRFFVPGQPAGLEADPVALVGLALGLDANDADASARDWLTGIIRRALQTEGDTGRMELLKLALALLTNDESAWLALSPMLQAAVAIKGKVAPTADVRRAALRQVIDPGPLEPEWALFGKAALETIFALEAAVDFEQATVEQVARLLRGVPAALKRWPWEQRPKTSGRTGQAQRWDIQNEYHVQSLLWALLRPVFPGLEDEEHLPSVGHKHPRADLLIPALRLVVEVKFLRDATQAARAEITEQVAADVGLYLTDGSGYDRIIPFIWDASASVHHHDEMANGLRKLRGIADVVIVSRPGEWRETGAA